MDGDGERYAVVDDRDAPLIRVWVVGDLNDRTFQQYQDDLLAAFRRQAEPFAVVAEQGPLRFFPLRLAAASARWVRSTKEEFGERWVCAAFVLRSPLFRRMMAAMVWASGNVADMAAFDSVDEAQAWCLTKLDRAEERKEEKVL